MSQHATDLQDQRARAQRHGPRQVVAASVGNAVEWYDWYLYTFLTPVLARVVFGGDEVSAVLSPRRSSRWGSGASCSRTRRRTPPSACWRRWSSCWAGLAAVLAAQLDDAQLASWGWRVGFAVGALIALVGLVIRRSAEETRAPVERSGRPGLLEALRRYPRQSALICGVTVGGTIAYYTWTTYLPTYAQQGGVPLERALTVSTVSLAFFALVQPVVGHLSDRVGRRLVLLAFGVVFTLGVVPGLALVRSSSSFAGLLAVSLLGMLVLAGFTSASAAVNAEIVPGRVRAAGIGFPCSLTVAAFGGTAPFVRTLFARLGHRARRGVGRDHDGEQRHRAGPGQHRDER